MRPLLNDLTGFFLRHALRRKSQGASVIMILGALFIALFCGIWAWDMASYYACQTQGQTAVDAAALGAAHDMRPDYSNEKQVINEAKSIAKRNMVMGRSLRDNELQVRWLTPTILKVSATYRKPNTAAPFLCAMAGRKNDPRCNFMPIYVEGYAKRRSDGITVLIPPTTLTYGTIAQGKVWGDPHFNAFGQNRHTYDIQGRPGVILSINNSPTQTDNAYLVDGAPNWPQTTLLGITFHRILTPHGDIDFTFNTLGQAIVNYPYEGWRNKAMKDGETVFFEVNDACGYKKLLGSAQLTRGAGIHYLIIDTGRMYITDTAYAYSHIDEILEIKRIGIPPASPKFGSGGSLTEPSLLYMTPDGKPLPMPNPRDYNGAGILPVHWTQYIVERKTPFGCPARGCSYGQPPVLGTCNGVAGGLTGALGVGR